MSRFPFPIPFGWFAIGRPEEFEVGAPQARFYLNRHLVVWRDEQQAIHVQDPFCPHLGAHLGHGGSVDGTCIVCPFHGWKFDGEGTNTEIPYSERVNRKARLRTYPAVERNGQLMIWYHPDATVAPMWEVPSLPGYDTPDEEWSTLISFEHVIETAWQELAENGVDSAHFRYVHDTATVPTLEEYTTGFPESQMRSSQKFPTPRGVMEGRIDSHMYGPGLSWVEFGGIIETRNMAVTTPIDEGHTRLQFNFRFKTMGDEETTRNVGKAFANEVNKQVLEDIPIWVHKAHLVRPALADNDGPFIKFRKWCAQFYAEVPGQAGGDERLVFEPPWYPDRADEAPRKATASARLGD